MAGPKLFDASIKLSMAVLKTALFLDLRQRYSSEIFIFTSMATIELSSMISFGSNRILIKISLRRYLTYPWRERFLKMLASEISEKLLAVD